jgi:hypothetical protein
MFKYCLIIVSICSSAFAQAQEKDVSKSKCSAPPYGATIYEYKTFMKTSEPGLTKKALHDAIETMCNVKYTVADRSIMHQLGITDEDINNKSTAELAILEYKLALKAIKEAQAESANCDAPPYGTTDNNYKAYAMSFAPSLGQDTVDKFIAMMCRIKYKEADRSGMYKVGITDKDIDKKDTPDLAIDLMKGVQKVLRSNE